MRNTHTLYLKDRNLLNNLMFKYSIANRQKAILVITKISCPIKVTHIYYPHPILFR